jgi:hypothetical protein
VATTSASLSMYGSGFRADKALQGALLAVPMASIFAALASFYYASTPLRLLAVSLGVAIYLYMTWASDNSALKTLSLTLLLISLPFSLLAAQRTEFRSVLVPFCFASAVGSSWYALEFRKTFLIFELPFYLYLGLSAFLVFGKSYGAAEFNEFFAGIGRNGYSAILVAMTAGYVISRTVRDKRPSLLILLCALVVAIPMYGRSSIVSLGFLCVTYAMIRKPTFAIVVLLLLASAVFAYLWVALEYLDLLTSATNFKAGLISDRWQMLGQYIGALNPGTLLTGVDMRELPAVVENEGSPDMALLRLHSFLGLSSVFYLIAIAYSAILLLRARKLMLLSLLVVILFRSFTDIILMFGVVDLFLMPVFFYPLYQRYWPPLVRSHVAAPS